MSDWAASRCLGTKALRSNSSDWAAVARRGVRIRRFVSLGDALLMRSFSQGVVPPSLGRSNMSHTTSLISRRAASPQHVATRPSTAAAAGARFGLLAAALSAILTISPAAKAASRGDRVRSVRHKRSASFESWSISSEKRHHAGGPRDHTTIR